MLRSISIVLFMIVVSQYAAAQVELTWEDFADITFEPEYNEKYDVHFLMPKFGEKIKTFQGKDVSITGYFLDLSGSGEIFLVSQNPMASCFFCGAAGPETIVEVHFKEKPPFKTDQIVTVSGVLDLNRNDVSHCNYILYKAAGELAN